MKEKKYLVIIDMQNDFVTGALKNDDAVGVAEKIVYYYQHNRFDRVVFTMDTHNQDYLNTLEGQNLPVPHCIKGTRGWEIVDELLFLAKQSTVVEKTTFGSLSWKKFIKDPTEITICGLVSDICVCSNALILRAMFPNTKIKVVSNLCAGLTKEKHNAAMSVMESCQIEVEE